MSQKKKYTNCDEIYKSLQKYFASKSFETGDRVPCERKISEELQVNRTTLRGALARMSKEGLIERKIGVGTFFKISPDEMRDNYTRINTQCSYVEILETRILLEPQIALIAALNVSTDDVKKLRNLCEIKDSNFLAIEEADIIFHDLLSEISANAMLGRLYTVISGIRKKFLNTTEDAVSCSSYDCALKWKEKQSNIIEALEQKNSKAAHDAVKQKLECIIGQYSRINQA